MRITVPIADEGMNGYFVYIPREIISAVAGQLTGLLSKRLYASAEDHERGYNAVSCVLGGIMTCSAKVLIEKIDSTYRLVDSVNNGTVYTVVSQEPLVIEPVIPDVPTSVAVLPGVKAQLDDARVKLQAIIDQMSADDIELEEIVTQLAQIGALLA